MQTWELWYPDAAASGLSFARCRVDPTGVLWVHAAPPKLAIVVRDGDDHVVARGDPAERRSPRTPMTRLWVSGGAVLREDRWPDDGDLGAVVVLPGGEAGTLVSWWNSPDHAEWRWRLEFYNRL